MEASKNDGGRNAVVEHFDRLSARGDWSRLYEVADGFSYHFHVRRARVLELLPMKLGDVVDVGCGPGVMTDAALERGGTFLGIDLSPEMVREAREKFSDRQNASFRVGDIEHLDLPDASFDQVICMAVLEYLATPDLALAEIGRVLKPGGTVIITVPKRRHVDHAMIALMTPLRLVARGLGAGKSDWLPRLCMQPDELDAAAVRAGLIPDGGSQYHFTPLPYPLPRIAPRLCLKINAPFERWHATRSPLKAFFAHGFVGRYRKPSSSV